MEQKREPLVLTFDLGTQSIRVLLAKKNGTFLDKEQFVYDVPYFSEKPYWAEQEPDYYYNAMCKICKTLLERNERYLPDIKSMVITTIRDTTLCLDKDMKPLRNIVLWLDKREADFNPRDLGLKKYIFKAIGMMDTIEAQTKASNCNWVKQNQPEIWEKTDKFVLLSAYLNYKMTGVLADSVGSTIGHIPFDYKNRTWMKANDMTRSMADVPNEKLYPLVEPGSTIGYITKETSELSGIPEGLPLIATASDKGCETLGLSVRKLGNASISFGTSATVQIASDKYIEPQPYLPAYPGAIPGVYNPEIQIFRGYWMLTWFISEFCKEECEAARRKGISPEQYMDQYLNNIPIGSDGLFISPFWTAGVANPNARGSMVGFTDRHTKNHIYRAIIEGINFELMFGLRNLERRSKTVVSEIFVGGGGAKSDEILQITADMFGVPVKRIQTHEACAIGASMVAFVAMGEFKDFDEASKAMIRVQNVFTPNRKNNERYEELYMNLYSGIYKGLDPVYKKEKKLYKKYLNLK